MIKIICDVAKCGKEIRALSSRPNLKNNTGVQIGAKHACSSCLLNLVKDGKGEK